MTVFDSNNIQDLVSKLNNQRVVFTNGCFDILHPGHIHYLTQARALGDCLVVGLNSDASVKALKGDNRPIHPESFRSAMLMGLKPVDYVVVFSDATPINVIQSLQPAVHVKGGDYTAESLPEYPVVTGYGGEVNIIPFLEGYSSTSILDRMQAG